MDRNMPIIVITEQPKQRGMRFRYECEGRSAGSIPGERTTQERKTWPSIQIVNYSGEATVRVSLVSKDSPPRPHPHSLVGKDCHNGVCTVRVLPETQMIATFSNLGIQCVKRREVAGALKLRQSLQVDPFNSRNNNDQQAADIDLNIVRLCFEAFISNGNNQHLVLQPVVSNEIYDKKATSSALLRICRVDKSFGSCKGGDEVYLLCDKVQKDDIQICFYEPNDRAPVTWEAYGEFSPTDVHRQVAIVFRTPPYRDPHLREAIKVLFQLKRISDGETSGAKDFTYLPQHHVQPQMRGPIPTVGVNRVLTKRTQDHVRDHIAKKVRTEPPTSTYYGPSQGSTNFGRQMPHRQFPSLPRSFPTAAPSPSSSFNVYESDNMLDRFLENPSFATPQFSSTLATGLGANRTPMQGSSFSNPRWTMPEQSAMVTTTQLTTPRDFNSPITNTPDIMAQTAIQQRGVMTSPLAPQHIDMGPARPSSAHLNYNLPPTPQGVVVGMPPTPEMDYNAPTPQNTEMGAVGVFSPTVAINYSIADSFSSFGDIMTEMTNLSIEKIDGVTQLVKTEPNANMLSELPMPVGQPPAYPANSNPELTMQAPSPQQIQSPQQQQLAIAAALDMGPRFPSIPFQDLEGTIPSFDLNDPRVESTKGFEDDLIQN